MELSSDSIATFHSRRTRASFAVVGFCDCTTVCYPSTVYFIISIYYLYRLFLGQECKRAWKMFNERQPTTQLTSPQVWHDYAKVLYDIPGQPPLPHPHGSCPHESTFFTPQNEMPLIGYNLERPRIMMDWLVSTLPIPVIPCSHC